MVIQWASGAKASSQYRVDRWTPECMTGNQMFTPNTVTTIRLGPHLP